MSTNGVNPSMIMALQLSNEDYAKGLFILGVVLAAALSWPPVFEGLAGMMASPLQGPEIGHTLLVAILVTAAAIGCIQFVMWLSKRGNSTPLPSTEA